MRDHFRDLVYSEKVKAVVITGAGKNFCSGRDVSEIIKSLTKMSMKELLSFSRMTVDFVNTIRNCRQPDMAAVDKICAGVGAILAIVSDFSVWFAYLRSHGFS